MVKVFKPIGIIPSNTTTIKTQQKDYVTTLLEFAANNYRQIAAHNSQVGTGTTTVYIVPNDSIFFLTDFNASSSQGGSIQLVSATGTRLEIAQWGSTVNFVSNLSSTFPMPLKFMPGSIISIVQAGAGCNTDATIHGFLVPFLP